MVITGVPWWLSRLRIQCCHCCAQVAAVVMASILGPGASICHGHNQKQPKPKPKDTYYAQISHSPGCGKILETSAYQVSGEVAVMEASSEDSRGTGLGGTAFQNSQEGEEMRHG